MGRELRIVLPGREHPKDASGRYIPLLSQSYKAALADYEYETRLRAEGRYPSQLEWPERTAGFMVMAI